MIKGKLYGIGTGAGDPELITLKAINTMEKCDVIAVPNGGSGDKTAFNIVKKYIEKNRCLNVNFQWIDVQKQEKRQGYRLQIKFVMF